MFLSYIEEELQSEGSWHDYYTEGGFADPDLAPDYDNSDWIAQDEALTVEFSKEELDIIGRALDHYWHTHPIDEVSKGARPISIKVREYIAKQHR